MITVSAFLARVRTALQANQSLVTMVSTRIYDVPPQQATVFPMVTFGPMSINEIGAKDIDLLEFMFQIDAWSEYEGRSEVAQMASYIVNSIHKLQIAGAIQCRFEGLSFIDEGDAATRHAAIRFRVSSGF